MRGTKLRRAGIAAAVAAAAVAASTEAASAAAFTVTNTADSGPGSLRAAITSANALSGGDEVRFNIPGTGVHTIPVTSAPLPEVTGRLKIDGTTQPGFTATPLIRVDNATGTTFTDGIVVSAGQSQVLALSVTGFGGGVVLRGPGGSNTVAGNRIGLTPQGAVDGNVVGVAVTGGSAGNVIGGTTTAARNVISGNGEGIVVDASDATKVRGNYVGTNPTGATAMGNANAGIRITGAAKDTVVGGSDAASRNVISGNRGGINVNGAGTTGTIIAGNRIGTNAAGSAAVPNQFFGVGILGEASGTTVGGSVVGARNVISGNTGASGVSIGGTGTANNVVAGNFIGTTANGATALSNGNGVLVGSGATGTRVGGDRGTARNLISGNESYGVNVQGAGTDDTVIAGNDIGLNATGAALPNVSGVSVSNGRRTLVGGATSARRNVISGNTLWGVLFTSDAQDGAVRGNYVGTNTTGTAAVPNGASGVYLAPKTSGNTVGGTTAGERNVISGNSGDGVAFSDADANVVSGNYIGLSVNGADPLGNVGFGVEIASGSNGNRIGGLTTGQRNVIAGNARGGIAIVEASKNLVQGNFVGTAKNGTSPIANAGPGVRLISGANDNTIGGTTSAAANLIAFNGGHGVVVDGYNAPTTGNAIQRNSIDDNALLGITLLNGGNGGQDPPSIGSVTTTATSTKVEGVVTGAPSTPLRVDLYASPVCDGSGFGEGRRYIGTRTVTTGANGAATFTAVVAPLAPGQVVTGTTTPGSGPQNTSAFSGCVAS